MSAYHMTIEDVINRYLGRLTLGDLVKKHSCRGKSVVQCSCCGADVRKLNTEINRAKKHGRNLYCDRSCAGKAKSNRPSNPLISHWGYMRGLGDKRFSGVMLPPDEVST